MTSTSVNGKGDHAAGGVLADWRTVEAANSVHCSSGDCKGETQTQLLPANGLGVRGVGG